MGYIEETCWVNTSLLNNREDQCEVWIDEFVSVGRSSLSLSLSLCCCCRFDVLVVFFLLICSCFLPVALCYAQLRSVSVCFSFHCFYCYPLFCLTVFFSILRFCPQPCVLLEHSGELSLRKLSRMQVGHWQRTTTRALARDIIAIAAPLNPLHTLCVLCNGKVSSLGHSKLQLTYKQLSQFHKPTSIWFVNHPSQPITCVDRVCLMCV